MLKYNQPLVHSLFGNCELLFPEHQEYPYIFLIISITSVVFDSWDCIDKEKVNNSSNKKNFFIIHSLNQDVYGDFQNLAYMTDFCKTFISLTDPV